MADPSRRCVRFLNYLLLFCILLWSSCHIHAFTTQKQIDRTSHQLRQSPFDADNDGTSPQEPRVRFSEAATFDDSVTTNPVDSILSFITSDMSSIAFGLIGVLILLVNRLWFASSFDEPETSTAVLEQETRSNLLALLACGSVLVNGVSKLNVDTVLAEQVELIGTLQDDVSFLDGATRMTNHEKATIEWGLSAIIAATPTMSAVLLQYNNDDQSWSIVALKGVLPIDTQIQVPSSTPIIDRCNMNAALQQETYLPTLQNLPGRIEFTYLPSNTQAVLILPAGQSRIIVLGSNQARSFTPRDIAWCLSVSSRIANEI
ncbi:hypothetical protein MPSEU_000235200 [Mayamaea pseudoterrestris]|nr:hypothetical protein MPSEU_000235200 [Mayamaea pseudoterrestris]